MGHFVKWRTDDQSDPKDMDNWSINKLLLYIVKIKSDSLVVHMYITYISSYQKLA